MSWDKQHIMRVAKKTGIVLLWSVLCASLISGVVLTYRESENTVCTRIEVNIINQNELNFIDREAVIAHMIPDADEKKIIGKKIIDIQVDSIESLLMTNSWVKHAEVFTDMNGELHIHIVQREPVLRVINMRNESFYLDKIGAKMPVSTKYTAHVPVATGYITEDMTQPDSLVTHGAKGLFKIATYVDKDAFWKAQIEQIFVSAESELILIPKIGDFQIVFGNTEDMESKFSRLMVFYREALPRVGWSKYSKLDVRFKNQIVTTKK